MDSRRSGLKMLAIALAICVSIGTAAWAQNPTGTLTGRVSNNEDGTPLPGVTVTATSPNLQGDRVTITGANGDYKLPLLPAGPYTVKYELEGMAARDVETKVSAAQTTQIDVGMAVAAIAEEILVTAAEAATISETSTAQSTYTAEEVGKLAINRDILNTVALAPGTSATGPLNSRGNATVISGAMSFESLWMVNGIVINENLRGQPLDLFIEDAIEETTVTTAGISAEYGRFTGGVVNVLTKSGGNEFQGSVRASLSNQDWTSTDVETDFNPDFESEDKINEVYELTLGGPIWKDRVWFFLAGRDRELETNEQTAQTFISFPQTDEQERYEGKLTIGLTKSHTLIGSYLEIDQVAANTFFPAEPLDLNVLTPRGDPQEIWSANYNGVLTSNFFLEAQYSEREWLVSEGAGGPRDLYDGSTWESIIDSAGWHAPTFCGECEGEERSNENALAKASYFLSTEGGGTHDFVVRLRHLQGHPLLGKPPVGLRLPPRRRGLLLRRPEQRVSDIEWRYRRGERCRRMGERVAGVRPRSRGPHRLQHQLVLHQRPLAAQRPLELQSRRALRRERRQERRRPAGGRRLQDQSASGRELRPQGRRRPRPQCDLRHLRGRHPEQPGRQHLERRRHRPRDPLLPWYADQSERRCLPGHQQLRQHRPGYPHGDRLVAGSHRFQSDHGPAREHRADPR